MMEWDQNIWTKKFSRLHIRFCSPAQQQQQPSGEGEDPAMATARGNTQRKGEGEGIFVPDWGWSDIGEDTDVAPRQMGVYKGKMGNPVLIGHD